MFYDVWVPVAFACFFLGGIIGTYRGLPGIGMILGLVFGPLGLLALLGMDARPMCPHCGTRLNQPSGRGPKCCAGCRQVLVWIKGRPVPPTEANSETAAAPSAARKVGSALGKIINQPDDPLFRPK